MTPGMTHRENAGIADVERLSPEENLARKLRDEAVRKECDRSLRRRAREQTFVLGFCLAGAVVIAGKLRNWRPLAVDNQSAGATFAA
jgi:hypothetical protein